MSTPTFPPRGAMPWDQVLRNYIDGADAVTAATADSAKTTADSAKTTADSAKTTADSAKTTADQAAASAGTAKTTADQAAASAGTAKTTADQALAKASAAPTVGGAEVVASALDFGGTARIALVGDSTANDPTDWPKTWAYMQKPNTPKMQIEYSGWNPTSKMWEHAANIQSADSAASGGLIANDAFTGAAGAELVGRTPDSMNRTGGGWAGNTGVWKLNGSGGLKAAKAGTANVSVESVPMTTTAVLNIVTATTATQGVRVVASCSAGSQGGGIAAHLYLTAGGALSCYLYYLDATGPTQIGTTQSLASIMPTNSATMKALTVKVQVDFQNITATLSTDLGSITMTAQITEAQYATLSTSSGLTAATATAPSFVVDSFQVETPATPGSAALLKLWNACVAGGTFATTLPVIDQVFPAATPLDVLVMMMGHNYSGMGADAFLALCDEYAAAFLQLHPGARIIVSSQNPQVAPAAGINQHKGRQYALRNWAQAKGYSYVGAFEAFSKRANGGKSLMAADGVNPNTTTEGVTTGEFGSVVWAQTFDAAIRAKRV